LLLLGISLMLLATAGCGDSPESEPVRKPPVLRKKITVPQPLKTGPAEASKAEKVEPVTVLPEDEMAQEAEGVIKDVQEAPGERKIVREIPAQPKEAEPVTEVREEKKPPSPPAGEVPAPEGKAKEEATEDGTAEVPAPQATKVAPAPQKGKPSVPPEESMPEVSIEGIGTEPPYEYNAVGKIDPFQPLFRIKAEPAAKAKKKVKKKRLPLTPLQKVSLGQLKVVGIIQLPGGDKALVEDAAGKGFIITKGTYIGQNFGRVKEILKDRVVVEEEVEDVLTGKMKLKTTELRLHKEAGDV
ncbi:MAG: pilus assembly protein PilP, partial [Thermodesulfobacteriota bacterium]|nr:pilus assembly protein PilP [Thermodesulfobacteriota bacterium]